MQTQLTLEERYCDAIFNQGNDFSKILALMLNGKDLALLESVISVEGADVDVVSSERLDIFSILSIYQKATLAGIKDTHTDTMLLHFLANQPASELPKIKQFTSRTCGAGFFAPALDSSFFHLDLSLLERTYIYPAIHAFFVYMYQKPHVGINLNIVMNEPTEIKIDELKRVCRFIFPFVVNKEFCELSKVHNYSIRICIRGNLIPGFSSAFRPINLIESMDTQRSETIANLGSTAAAEPPYKKPRSMNDDSEFAAEQIAKFCLPI